MAIGEGLVLGLPEWLMSAITTTRGTSLVLEALDQTYTHRLVQGAGETDSLLLCTEYVCNL